MTDLLRLLFLVPLGYIAAVSGAAFTILAGWYGHQTDAIFADVEQTGYLVGVAVWLELQVGALAAIPSFVIVVLAEVLGWRSIFFYLAVGGALGLLGGQVRGAIWDAPGDQLLLLAAGFVGGLAYWLIAGRLAGLARVPKPSSPPPAAPPAPPTSPG